MEAIPGHWMRYVTATYASPLEAQQAAYDFRQRFQVKNVADRLYEFVAIADLDLKADAPLLDIVSKLVLIFSRSHIRRLFQDGAIMLDGQVQLDPFDKSPPGIKEVKLKIGKRLFFRVGL